MMSPSERALLLAVATVLQGRLAQEHVVGCVADLEVLQEAMENFTDVSFSHYEPSSTYPHHAIAVFSDGSRDPDYRHGA